MLERDLGTHGQRLSDNDYEYLIQTVTSYTENDDTIPKGINAIRNLNTTQGNVVHTFRLLYKEIRPTSTKRPDSLSQLIKDLFHELRGKKLSNLKKTNELQYYKQITNIS